ncbi:MAG: biotin/lipoyl-binding protein [Bifidobacteriaceae bacterium]|jgi:HlyD family secretion protein|nr:biotin/lipoyl-binding protein [Bifidobacteriaceae bacterium]
MKLAMFRSGAGSTTAEGRRRHGSQKGRAILVVGVLVVAVGGGGGAAYALTQSGGPRYRTALAQEGSVVQQASGTGTVGAISLQQAAFRLDGTVESVGVTVGQSVEPGQVLATLETADLDESVLQAEQTLADAKDQLAADLEAQASGSAAAATAMNAASDVAYSLSSGATEASAVSASNALYSAKVSTANVTASNTAQASLDEVNAAIEAVKTAQTALLEAYQVAEGLLQEAEGSLAGSEAACASFMAAVFPGPDDSATDPDTLTTIQQSLIECQTAMVGTQAAQNALGTGQAALLEKAAALNNAVADLSAALDDLDLGSGGGNAGTPTEPTEPDPKPGGSASGNAGPGAGTQATTITAERILADQAQITLLEAELGIAANNRQAATLTSSTSGTVVGVNATAGDSVSAGQVVAVVDAGQGFTVSLTLGLQTVKELSRGNPAVFTAGSTSQDLTGEIVAIGITNQSSTSIPSFTVELAVDQTSAVIYSGASVKVVITVASADNVVTVPTSAVHVSATGASVQMVGETGLVEVPVTLGAMGPELTEITSGISLGETVVLADLSKDVIGETSSNRGSSRSTLLGGDTTFRSGGGLTVNVVPPVMTGISGG